LPKEILRDEYMLTKLPVILLFCIGVTPHLNIGNNLLYLDDLPVILILGIFIITMFQGRDFILRKVYKMKYFYFWVLFLIYILLNPSIVLGYFSITTDFMRYAFLFTVLFLLFYFEDSKDFISRVSTGLLILLSLFSIVSFFFELSFGTDAYNYWKIGFNPNNWGFTGGRINGFQAGGPNSFGDLICILTLKVVSDNKVNGRIYNLILFMGYTGCFFTFSRSSILVLTFFSIILLILQKRTSSLVILSAAILLSVNFGLVDRFLSQSETDGIKDRIEMQSATAQIIQERSAKNSIFGYGFNQFAVVRSEVKPINEFSDNLRPTGPHNGYAFQLLNYGYVGLVLFLALVIYPLLRLNSYRVSYLVGTQNLLPISAFLVLNFAGDLFQNQSIAWIFWLYLFELYKEHS